jgi:hypothetical protein
MTEWTPATYADFSTAFRQSTPYARVFGVYNLQVLEQSS